MRTTLDIDAALLDEAVRRLRTRTKRETVELALREAISSRKRQQLRDLLGSFDLDLTQEDLERMRGES
ncbi:MAG: type II toxin-antitoxin system VapB family antitoxin [Thermoleophilia bacterium]|nr:type II toxin-antitoxin system VapB family antitoxin [Thermoleophilia bacterium]